MSLVTSMVVTTHHAYPDHLSRVKLTDVTFKVRNLACAERTWASSSELPMATQSHHTRNPDGGMAMFSPMASSPCDMSKISPMMAAFIGAGGNTTEVTEDFTDLDDMLR